MGVLAAPSRAEPDGMLPLFEQVVVRRPKLVHLNLSHNVMLGSNGLRKISKWLGESTLQSLNLSHCDIGNSGLLELAQVGASCTEL